MKFTRGTNVVLAGTLQEADRLARERYDALKNAVLDTEQMIAGVVKRKMNFDHNRDTTLAWLQGLDRVLTALEETPAADQQRSATLKASKHKHTFSLRCFLFMTCVYFCHCKLKFCQQPFAAVLQNITERMLTFVYFSVTFYSLANFS